MKYRIETRKDKYAPWELFLDWTDWDTAYAAYLPEYARKSDEQWEGFVNIRIVRDVNEDLALDNCSLYDAWIRITRNQQAKQRAIIEAVEAIRYYVESEGLSGVDEQLQIILDNLEEVRGEDWDEKRLRSVK